MQKIILISGLTNNHVIGKDNSLPWYIKEDFQLFKEKTLENVIIMGRKTWESLPKKPLSKRENIVISRTMEAGDGYLVFTSLADGIKYSSQEHQDKDIFIIGGASIYTEGLDYATHMYLSHIKKEYEGDTYFPKFDENQWNVTKQKEYDEFVFNVWERK